MAQELVDIVSKSSKQSLIDAQKYAENLNKSLQDTIVYAKQANDNLSGSKGLEDFNKKAELARQAQERTAKAIANTQLAEEKLSAFRAKEEKRLIAEQQKQIEADNRKIAKIQEIEAKEAAAANAKIERIKRIEAQEVSRSSKSQQQLVQEQKSNKQYTDAELNYAAARSKNTANTLTNTAATKGNAKSKIENSIADVKATVSTAANNAAIKRQAIESIAAKGSIDQRTAALARLTATYYSLNAAERASAAGIRLGTQIIPGLTAQVATLTATNRAAAASSATLATTLGTGFTTLKTITNILPGIGIAGLLAFAVGPLIDWIKNLGIFRKELSQSVENLKAFNEVNSEYAKEAGKDINTLKLLYKAATDVTLSIKDRTAAAKELQKQFPEAFKNSETQAILNGKEKITYDDLTRSILETSKAKAVKSKLDELEAKKLDIAIQKNKINNATQNEVNRQSDATVKGINEQNKLYTEAQAKFRITQAQTNKLINENVIKPALERNADAIKIQNDQEKIINGQIDFLIKYAGLANLAGAVTTKDPKSKSTEADARRSASGLIQAQIEAQKKIADIYRAQADNPDFSLEARLDAQEKFDAASIKIAELTGKKELAIKKNTANEIKAIDASVETNKSKVLTDSVKFQNKLYSDALKREVEAFKEGTRVLEEQLKQRVSARIEASNIELENVENTRVELSNKAGEDYTNGIIKREEYQRKLNQIDREAAKRALEIQIATNDAIIDIQQADLDNFGIGDQKSINDNLRKNTALKIRLSKLGTDAVIEDLEREKRAREEVNDAIKKLAFDAFDLGKQIVGQMFDARVDAVDKEIETLDQRTKTEIENINESVLSEKEKADKIAIIEANAANKRQQLEQKQRQIKIQQARVDRAFQVGEAIAATALAVVKALPNLVLAGIVGAIGAIQIASIIAAPMPKFAKGGTMKADGLAEYGHGTEIMITPDGKASLTSSTPEVGFVQKGTQFISAPDTKRLLAKPQLNDYAGKSWDVERLINEQKTSTKELKKAILRREKQRSVSEFSRSETQMRAYYKRNGF